MNDLDLPIRLIVTKLTFVARLEIGTYAFKIETWDRNLQRPLLADLAEIEASLEHQIRQ